MSSRMGVHPPSFMAPGRQAGTVGRHRRTWSRRTMAAMSGTGRRMASYTLRPVACAHRSTSGHTHSSPMLRWATGSGKSE